MTAVQIEVNGAMIPARDATWYQVAPCGCTSGATVVEMPYSGEIRTDGEAAFGEGLTAAERAQDKSQGYTYELGHRSEVVDRMRATCEHDPKWGIEPRPEIAGMLWAASRDSRVLHLVSDEYVATEANRRVGAKDIAAICGALSYSWADLWHRVSGKVECKRCVKAARQAVSA